MFLSSLYFALLAKLKIWQTIETYSPQTFSITAAVVTPAVVICLNSLLIKVTPVTIFSNNSKSFPHYCFFVLYCYVHKWLNILFSEKAGHLQFATSWHCI